MASPIIAENFERGDKVKFKTVSDFKRLCPELFKMWATDKVKWQVVDGYLVAEITKSQFRLYAVDGESLIFIGTMETLADVKVRIKERILNGEDNPSSAGE
jgi:hypothetical protein